MATIEKLLEIMARLRDPQDGCPWDVEQDFASIAPYTVEEAYEVADAIAREDLGALRDELGDLLFQVVFHARMAEEAGAFDFAAVVDAVSGKMLRRHPHVFGTDDERRQGAVPGSWERIKAGEREADPGAAGASALDGIAMALPALKRAQKLGKRAAQVGFDWPDRQGVRAKIEEELEELEAAIDDGSRQSIDEEIGDLLFAVANLARHVGTDPEQALSDANRKFDRRFRDVEAVLRAEGHSPADLDLEALERHWQAAKARLAART